MKLAISNIAWHKEEEEEIAQLLKSLGVKYVEIAPTKTWDEPIEVLSSDTEAYKQWWGNHGIEIIAFQSMLFAHPEYKIFDSETLRDTTKEYLQEFIQLAGRMGVTRMVFGSPRNRQREEMPDAEALNIAGAFFREIAATAKDNNVVFCIEPNATQYNCDFITNAQEGLALVNDIDHEGFGLHLDTGCMVLAGDDIGSAIVNAGRTLKHFHISSPMLEAVDSSTEIDHKLAADALKKVNYEGYVSIEMRPGDLGTNASRVEKAIRYAQEVYFRD